MEFKEVIEWIGLAIEAVGVAIICVGVVGALLVGGRRVLAGTHGGLYVQVRRQVGRAILLGLEVLVAGDIIRTVATDPTFTSVGVLAIIVAIRTFLSFTLEMEVTGRWPWQSAGSDDAGPSRETSPSTAS
ncbi:DUF1622 domain-containing protein [Rhabdothermincola salaria]|uniref:DUF1622 domain-containing protein n=1 Tax=Rhabdothermincola salaria TaxID=2903142 RepID=UPI001E639988|nr:DUF1622 domain-containing protein [Rhabdothermincola salaria]MCD9622936.1 DUF1622 domain-containing protein [Rhabdothermincola salaria]